MRNVVLVIIVIVSVALLGVINSLAYKDGSFNLESFPITGYDIWSDYLDTPSSERPPNIEGTCPCGDTPENSCSLNIPYYCENLGGGNCALSPNCEVCGCPPDQACSTDGFCVDSSVVCSDGTREGTCSFDPPNYCSSGNLVENCGTCGCPNGYLCLEDNSCLKLPPEISEDTRDIAQVVNLLNEKIKLSEKINDEELDYIKYVFDFKGYETPFARLTAYTIRDADANLPPEKAELVIEELSRDDIIARTKEKISNKIEEEIRKSAAPLPEKVVTVSGLRDPSTTPKEDVELSPFQKIVDFQLLLSVLNERPYVDIEFDSAI